MVTLICTEVGGVSGYSKLLSNCGTKKTFTCGVGIVWLGRCVIHGCRFTADRIMATQMHDTLFAVRLR